MTAPSSGTAEKPKPSGLTYLLPLAIFVIASGFAFYMLFAGIQRRDDVIDNFARFESGSTATVDLKDSGTYTIWVELPSSESSPLTTPNTSALVFDPEGEAVKVTTSDATIDTFSNGSTEGSAVHEFRAAKAGEYRIGAVYNGRGKATFAVGRDNPDGEAAKGVLMFFLVGTIGFVVSLIVTIIIMVMRGRSKRRIRAARLSQGGYAGGYGTPTYGAPTYGGPGAAAGYASSAPPSAPVFGAPDYTPPAYDSPRYGTPGYETPGYGAPGTGEGAGGLSFSDPPPRDLPPAAPGPPPVEGPFGAVPDADATQAVPTAFGAPAGEVPGYGSPTSGPPGAPPDPNATQAIPTFGAPAGEVPGYGAPGAGESGGGLSFSAPPPRDPPAGAPPPAAPAPAPPPAEDPFGAVPDPDATQAIPPAFGPAPGAPGPPAEETSPPPPPGGDDAPPPPPSP